MEQVAPALDLAHKQRRVRRGAALAAAGTVAVVGGVYALVPTLEMPSAGDRIAFALRWAVFPALTLLAGLRAVGRGRYRSEAIDPLAGAERGPMVVHGRYVDNTVEQIVLHVIATVGLAVDGTSVGLRLVPAMTASFVVGRIVFWIGYLRDPIQRVPGFGMTAIPTVLALGYLAVRTLWRLAAGG